MRTQPNCNYCYRQATCNCSCSLTARYAHMHPHPSDAGSQTESQPNPRPNPSQWLRCGLLDRWPLGDHLSRMARWQVGINSKNVWALIKGRSVGCRWRSCVPTPVSSFQFPVFSFRSRIPRRRLVTGHSWAKSNLLTLALLTHLIHNCQHYLPGLI